MASLKVYSIYHGRFPGERAATLFAAKEAESFADTGAEVALLVPRRLGRSKQDAYEYFHVRKNFRVVFLPTIDLFGVPILSRIAFPVSFIVFGFCTTLYLLFCAKKEDLIYSNESFPILLSTWFFPRTMVAVHDFPEHKEGYYRLLFRRVGKILSTNAWKKEALIKKFTLPGTKIAVIPNAVDVTEFALNMSKEEARKKLGLEPQKRYVVYTGHLYSWKGVDTLAEAAKLLPEDVEVLFVGGREGDIAAFREKYNNTKNIRLIGFRPHAEIPLWQSAADVLVLPNTAKEEISARYTSPMKLFEYMASGRPIVASRIPSITEIVSDEEVFLVPSDEPRALADGIVQTKEDSSRPARALLLAKQSTWVNRAQQVLRSFSL